MVENMKFGNINCQTSPKFADETFYFQLKYQLLGKNDK